METNWKQTDEENERLFENNMDEAKKASAAAKVFFGAAQIARRQAKENRILPGRTMNMENYGGRFSKA